MEFARVADEVHPDMGTSTVEVVARMFHGAFRNRFSWGAFLDIDTTNMSRNLSVLILAQTED
ncbi:MAG: hypothetical protein LLG04_15645 [Parachlamydia sp.]|nr:hypothetical protein [Parachlamydia sp.]